MGKIAIYAACWPGMVVLAVVNGILREKTYGKHLGELAAHQISSLVMIGIIGLYTWILAGLSPIESAWQGWIVGALWMTLTAAFEFLFGRLVMKRLWRTLLHDYNLKRGRIWALVLVWTGAAPGVLYLMCGA